MEIKDRKINVLQRKIENLEDLLKEKDNQIDMARGRLAQYQLGSGLGNDPISMPLRDLEDAIGDKERVIGQLREQRDRAEGEKVGVLVIFLFYWLGLCWPALL